MNKPRVLIIENSLDFTGGLNSALRSSSWLREQFDFQFLLPAGSRSSLFLKDAGFPVHEMPMREIRKSLAAAVLYFPRLVRNAVRFFKLLKKHEIDLVISNDFYNLIPPTYKILGGNIPYVCFVRLLPSRFPKGLAGMWYSLHARHAAKILAVSERVKVELPPNAKVVVQYDGMEVRPFAPYDKNATSLLYLANYIPGKGQEYAIQSFAKIAFRFPTWKLRFVGSDMGLEKNRKFKNELIKLSRKLGCDPQVEWNDFSTNTQREYALTAIVLNFSDSESFSLTVQEALFHARPVIATDSGGPSEILNNSMGGIIVSRRDIDAMAAAMTRLIADPELRKQMAEEGYKSMIARFNPAMTFEKLKTLLFEVLGR
jgi:glycosyltransferase involved in cell wall biosynthesis